MSDGKWTENRKLVKVEEHTERVISVSGDGPVVVGDLRAFLAQCDGQGVADKQVVDAWLLPSPHTWLSRLSVTVRQEAPPDESRRNPW